MKTFQPPPCSTKAPRDQGALRRASGIDLAIPAVPEEFKVATVEQLAYMRAECEAAQRTRITCNTIYPWKTRTPLSFDRPASSTMVGRGPWLSPTQSRSLRSAPEQHPPVHNETFTQNNETTRSSTNWVQGEMPRYSWPSRKFLACFNQPA